MKLLIVREKKKEKTILRQFSLVQTFEAVRYLALDFSINKCF